MVGLAGLELRGHVTGSVDGSKGQAIVLDDVSTKDFTLTALISHKIWPPVLENVKVKRINPPSGSSGWYGCIGVSRVLEEPIFVHHGFPNPLRCFNATLIEESVLLAYTQIPVARALIVLGNVSWNIQLFHHILTAEIVNDWATESAWWQHSSKLVVTTWLSFEAPWCVVGSCEVWLFARLNIALFGRSETCVRRVRQEAMSEDIIDVDIIVPQIIELHHCIVTGLILWWHQFVERAVVVLLLHVEFLVDE